MKHEWAIWQRYYQRRGTIRRRRRRRNSRQGQHDASAGDTDGCRDGRRPLAAMDAMGNKMNQGREIDRRGFIRGLSALGLSECTWRRAAAQAATVPLQRLAEEKGLMFGSSLALKYCVQSAAYQQLFISQCDIATPELHMKWDSLQRGRDYAMHSGTTGHRKTKRLSPGCSHMTR